MVGRTSEQGKELCSGVAAATEHHSNHAADAWSIQISDQEEPAPSAPVSEIGLNLTAGCWLLVPLQAAQHV